MSLSRFSAWLTASVVAVVCLQPQCATALAAEQRLTPGWQKLRFAQMPGEQFEAYVPKNLRPGKPCGVLVWVSPFNQLYGIRRFEPLYEEFNLIAITAANSGNDQQTDRRLSLAVGGVAGLAKMQPIDRRRAVLSGMSGGGRIAAIGGFVQPDVWAGVISWCGSRFYRKFPISAGSKHPGTGINTPQNPNLVTPELVQKARAHVKFVLLTGTNDFNRDESMDIWRVMTDEKFQAKFIQETGLGHEIGSVETMRRALEFVLGPAPR